MSNRVKLKIEAPRTREEMETLVGEIAALKIEERRQTAEMDEALRRLRDSYQERLTSIKERLAALMPRALAWAETHPDAFGKLRSIEMLHGVIGWRTNTPSLKPLSGWTWDRVLEKLKALPSMLGYVRVKEEANKQAILADRDQLGPEGLRAIGCRVVQEDEFFVDPKLTETETREVAS